jgi:hypothetical protein
LETPAAELAPHRGHTADPSIAMLSMVSIFGVPRQRGDQRPHTTRAEIAGAETYIYCG